MAASGDLLVTNGRIVTLTDAQPEAEAVLVRDGRIATLGSEAQLRREAHDATTLDLGGATLLPGFVDAHTHLELTSISLERYLSAHTPPCESLDDVAAVIRRHHDPAPDYPWTVCRSSFGLQDKVAEQRLFRRDELDRLSPDRPLIVFAGLHVAMLNTAALRELRLLDGDPPRGSIVHRDPDGRPNGTVTEVFHLLPSWPEAAVATAISRRQREVLLANGITTASSIPMSRAEMHATARAIRTGDLGVRMHHYPVVPWALGSDELDELVTWGRTARYDVPGIKLFVDGQGGDGLEQKLDDLKYDQDELDDLVRRADAADLQVIMHAVTTTGIHMAARAIAAVSTGPAGNRLRHRIEHGADYADPADIAVLKRSGAVLITTPHFLRSESGASLPPAPLRSLLAAGVPVAGGTDSTGTVPEGCSPLYNVWCAATPRMGSSGLTNEQTLHRGQALRLFTTYAADAVPGPIDRGRLAPGLLGDLVVVSGNPLEVDASGLGDLRVVATIVGGEVVHTA